MSWIFLVIDIALCRVRRRNWLGGFPVACNYRERDDSSHQSKQKLSHFSFSSKDQSGLLYI